MRLLWRSAAGRLALPRQLLAHVDDTADAVAGLHVVEGAVDLVERLAVRDELVHLELARHVVVHEPRQLRPPLDAAKRAAAPRAPRHELECWRSRSCQQAVCHARKQKEEKEKKGPTKEVREKRLTSCRDFLSGGRDADDDALAPALMAGLERRPHDADVASAVKGVVAAAISHLNQLLLDALLAQLGRVDKVRGAKLLAPLLLGVVDIDDDDLGGPVSDAALHDAQADAAGAEDSHVGPLLYAAVAGRDDGRAVARRDAAAEQAGAVHGRLVGDGDDANVRDDRVLREGRRAHEVQQVLALALEARGPVGHHALALRAADLPAQVRLARFAELAFPTFGRAGVDSCER